MDPANRRYADALEGGAAVARGLPLTLVGYWEGEWAPGWPRATDFVDEHWDSVERDIVASYLEQGLVDPWVQAGWSDCRFCGAANGSLERTDGVYVWPGGLSYYLREHGVRPPVSVIRHIISVQAIAQPWPSEDEVWFKRLRGVDGYDLGPGPDSWLKARLNDEWWRTATLDS